MTRHIHMVLKKFLTGCGLWISLQKTLLIAGKKIFRGLLSVHRRGIKLRQSKEKIGQVCKKKLGFFRFPCYPR
ncbi:hypothetical protein BTH55_08390 [Lactobacillus delbrueckii subsp. bulgaricus]|uniref:hypothetical protein n=1 Tax=Lactobacillus delbrueckii TaxID=1584 RepID=UPI0012DB3C4B|nr:hypothetical protein [Lactobacillus delbrueckii]MBT8811910.1 hypothetical protein [Lactobacillus delbrueckii subsp. bulgaricus]MBT8845062.1 hypothetical protein [Lactobacillus delbrueckii subsp. bulgaricus]MBT8848339.1 hypothetical protein [Lactobacillus delbrueckii subsp. bulgaricus]MBT8852975.1 hypothetical protein [Lactobacillus delbrueckii subsp. bulgaricus]MBT8854660.1 hypothetical protein [Lactobacillus delbrueckii subsp. bulgaricus]